MINLLLSNANRLKAGLQQFSIAQIDGLGVRIEADHAAGVNTDTEYFNKLSDLDIQYWNNHIALVQVSTQMEQQLRLKADSNFDIVL